MKRFSLLLVLLILIGLCGCGRDTGTVDIVATTKPVYDFTLSLCEGTGLEVTLLISDSVSCLHDYTLSTNQMRHLERANLIITNGAGLESFADDVLKDKVNVVDSSICVPLLEICHAHEEEHEHHHDADPHIWLSPANAKIMCQNICQALTAQYPQHEAIFEQNLTSLLIKLDDLQIYGESQLASLSSRKLITFHDGFAYLAEAFNLEILSSIEEDDGSTISAAKRIGLLEMIKANNISAIFIETNGYAGSARSIASEAGIEVFTLDTAMSDADYFDAMRQNIKTLKGALG